MRENFEPSLAFTLSFEGGYVNHPADPGGHTNKGVTLATLRRHKPGATVADLKAIGSDMLARIYRNDYWHAVSADRLAAGVDGATFDYAVNSGPGAAKKSLLKVVGGPDHETVKKLCARRLSIYQGLKHWKTFGKGWTRRIVAGEALWVKWALAARNDAAVVKQQLEDEAQAAGKTARQQGQGAATAGGGGAVGTSVGADQAADQLAALLIGGGLLLAAGIVAFLLWRRYINRQRAAAYAIEADEVAI